MSASGYDLEPNTAAAASGCKCPTRERIQRLGAAWLADETNLSVEYCGDASRRFVAVLFDMSASK